MNLRRSHWLVQFVKDTWGAYPGHTPWFVVALLLAIAVLPWSLPVIILDRKNRTGDTPDIPGFYGIITALIWGLVASPTVRQTDLFLIIMLFSSIFVPVAIGAVAAVVLIPGYWIWRLEQWRKKRKSNARAALARVQGDLGAVSKGDIVIVDGKRLMVDEVESPTSIKVRGCPWYVKMMYWAGRQWQRAAIATRISYDEEPV